MALLKLLSYARITNCGSGACTPFIRIINLAPASIFYSKHSRATPENAYASVSKASLLFRFSTSAESENPPGFCFQRFEV
jgi:hypothetical protein